MEVVLAALALLLALTSVLVAVVLLQNVRRLQSQISKLDKKISEISSEVEVQEAALRAIRANLTSPTTNFGMLAAPFLTTLMGAKKRGVAPTAMMLGLNLVQTMIQRKRGSNLPAKIQ